MLDLAYVWQGIPFVQTVENTWKYGTLPSIEVLPSTWQVCWNLNKNIKHTWRICIYHISHRIRVEKAPGKRSKTYATWRVYLLSNCTCAEKNSRLRLEMKPSQAVLWVSMIFLHIWYHSPCNFENGKSPVSEIIPVFLQPALVWIKLRYFS